MCLPCQYDEPANTDRLLCSRLSRLGCFWVAAYLLSLQRRIKDAHTPMSGSMAFLAEMPLQFELPCAYGSPLGFLTPVVRTQSERRRFFREVAAFLW